MSESEWVEALVDPIQAELDKRMGSDPKVVIQTQKRLPYAYEVKQYKGTSPIPHRAWGYATDFLVSDRIDDEHWIPRVVVEAKLSRITTHAALTYSRKAATHKHVHPYLRYGILIGQWKSTNFPARLFRHGEHFDFMMTCRDLQPFEGDWRAFVDILEDEVITSRTVQQIVKSGRSDCKSFQIVRRPIKLL